jgi:hypothetical protein
VRTRSSAFASKGSRSASATSELRVRDAGLAVDRNRLSDHGRRKVHADDLADVRREGLLEEARAAGHVERALVAARGDSSEEAAHRLRLIHVGRLNEALHLRGELRDGIFGVHTARILPSDFKVYKSFLPNKP